MLRTIPSRVSLLVAFAIASFEQSATAQCGGEWVNDMALRGSGIANAICATPDGGYVVGGRFVTQSPTGTLHNIGRFSDGEWRALGSGIRSTINVPEVFAVAVSATGEIAVAGIFDRAGEVEALNIAVWRDDAWHPVGGGINSSGALTQISALVYLPNGDLIAAGMFNRAGEIAVNNIARWDGSNWNRLGNGIPSTSYTTRVHALAVIDNGDLIAAGTFSFAGLVTANNIARWDGDAWNAMGTGLQHSVNAVSELRGGDVLAISQLLFRWNGKSWAPFQPMSTGGGGGITEPRNGTICSGILYYNGENWFRFVDGMEINDSASRGTGDLIVAGFGHSGTNDGLLVANWREEHAPAVCNQPESTIVCFGERATFDITVSGLPPFEYQWRRNGVDVTDVPGDVSGSRTRELRIHWATLEDHLAQYTCAVRNASGETESEAGVLELCVGDLSCDAIVDEFDVEILLESFGKTNGVSYYFGDLNGDRIIDLYDLALMLSRLGTSCE